MNRDQRRAHEADRLFEEQRARVSTLDATGILGVAVFVLVMFWGDLFVAAWAFVLLSQVVAGYSTRQVESRFGRVFELWWVSGSSVAWAALPLLVLDDAADVNTAWILTSVLVFGIASDAVYLPQTYQRNVLLTNAAYSVPYLFVLGFQDHWAQVVLIFGVLIHLGWGAAGISGLVDDLISRRVDAVITAERASHSARSDSLTGLLNRSGVLADLRTTASAGDETIHCVFVDLDDFKTVNDQLGYDAGDRLLARVATSLQAVFPEQWSVGRFGGDEFIAAGVGGDLEAIADQLEVMRLAPESGLFARRRPFIRASAGMVSLRPSEGGIDDLVAHASAALREAKKRGKNSIVVSDADFREELRRANIRSADLEHAIASGQFVPYLQPLVDLDSGDVRGVEVLARWDRADGMVYPDVFIPQIEERGFSHQFDRAMIARGIEVLHDLSEIGRTDLSVSVNVSATHLQDGDLPQRLNHELAQASIAPSRLTLEVTESDSLSTGEVAPQVAAELRSMGVGLSIDDFGTGYSSMTQLLTFPFSEMKLDRSLIGRVGTPDADDLLMAIADFGNRNGLNVVAEGIETDQQLDAVRRLGVATGQGYLFDRPCSSADFIDGLSGEPPMQVAA
jgi:diguanylate cyclase (GGDEF)-like protein